MTGGRLSPCVCTAGGLGHEGELVAESSGRPDEGESAGAVELKQVVDRAVEARLGSGRGLVAQQQQQRVLDGVRLAVPVSKPIPKMHCKCL
jgi:hypothetical protein